MNILKIFLFYLVSSVAIAGPGAHGPNGEHLDAPNAQVRSEAGPRIETFTESFELVGRIHNGELSVLIDRYETNEPVLNGKLEVELNGLKAMGKYRPESGDYVIADEGFVKALAAPGKHALIFALSAAEESDLLEGTLEVQPEDKHESNTQFPFAWAGAGLLVALALIALAVRLRRPARPTEK